ncbi:GNAT family N-acetyltransferase [Mariniflexile sp. HMF6888]|uniref:GNAT family N-acetyltransferase n=1 Tax=Mariniflexile sp. HMF6888 TaxID=3373086 RepID=UPI0037916E97
MPYITREQFLWDFLKKEMIPNCIESVELNDFSFINKNSAIDNHDNKHLAIISLAPNYLKFNFSNKESYLEEKIDNIHLDGCGIVINEKETLESYLKNVLSTQTRKNVKRFWNRLNQSFNIEIKYYFGHISEETCAFLLSKLHNMVIKRFDDKKTINSFIFNWENNTKNVFSSINNKKASLFVIYSDGIPINITLNYHSYNAILYAECNGFDQDYYKFGLGHIDNYILLKWCITNNYKYLDLGNGMMDYKKKWSNSFYKMQYIVYFNNKNLVSKTLASTEIFKVKTKNFFKKIKLDTFIIYLKHFLKSPKTDSKNANMTYNLEKIDDTALNKLVDLIEVDLKANDFLRKPVYDSIFNSKEHINDIIIYKFSKNTYIIKGKKTVLKLTIGTC